MVYASFADESRHSHGRYRSIAAVSLPADSVVEISEQMAKILDIPRRKEIKWSGVGDLRGKGDVRRAIAVMDFLLEHVTQGVRADVLTWDTEDERHDIPDRDDVANYERMFFHLHHALIHRRGLDSHWHLRPDEIMTIDWSTIRKCLDSKGSLIRSIFDDFPLVFPAVLTFDTVDSVDTPLCQLADLLAGMAAYTRTKYQVMKKMIHAEPGQCDLFEQPEQTVPTRRDRYRFQVIEHFYQECRLRKLGVSLRECGYLRTRQPKNPVNFWHYVPQHGMDKAPTRTQTGNGLRETVEGSPYSAR